MSRPAKFGRDLRGCVPSRGVELGLGEINAATEVGGAQVRAPEVRGTDVGSPQIGRAEVRFDEQGTAQIRPDEIDLR